MSYVIYLLQKIKLLLQVTKEWGPAGRSICSTVSSSRTDKYDTTKNTTTVLINGAHDNGDGEEFVL